MRCKLKTLLISQLTLLCVHWIFNLADSTEYNCQSNQKRKFSCHATSTPPSVILDDPTESIHLCPSTIRCDSFSSIPTTLKTTEFAGSSSQVTTPTTGTFVSRTTESTIAISSSTKTDPLTTAISSHQSTSEPTSTRPTTSESTTTQTTITFPTSSKTTTSGSTTTQTTSTSSTTTQPTTSELTTTQTTITFPTSSKTTTSGSTTTQTTSTSLTTTQPMTSGSTTTQTTSTSSTTTQPTTSESTTTQPTTTLSITTQSATSLSTTTQPMTSGSTTTQTTSTSLTTTQPTTSESTTTQPTTTLSTTTETTTSNSITTKPTTGFFSGYTIYRKRRNAQDIQLSTQNGEITVDHCLSNHTFNVTYAGVGQLWCQEQFEDHCQSNPCYNGATCVNKHYSYECNCTSGFTDPECMTQINLCENYPCDPFGTCIDFLNGYNCTCKKGFQFVNATFCEDIDECDQMNDTRNNSSLRPCESGSTCRNYEGGYECLCPKEKFGFHCEINSTGSDIIQYVTSISSTFGLMAGGGLLTFTGINLCVYPALGAYFLPENNSALYGHSVDIGNNIGCVSVRIPRAPSTDYIGQNMTLVIKYSQEKNVTAGKNITYTYTDNPTITNITPSVVRINAGVRLTITGQNLNSVSMAVLKVYFVSNKYVWKIDSELNTTCSGVNSEKMICTLPAINVSNINTTGSRRKRSAIDDEPSDSFVGGISKWLGHVTGWGRKKRSDDPITNDNNNMTYYLGLYFDDFPKYTNLTRSLPRLVPKPIILKSNFNTTTEPVDFDPRSDESFKILGDKMDYGCSKDDYRVYIGAGYCEVIDLQTNLLQCKPPMAKPLLGPKAAVYQCADTLPVLVYIGSLENFYACVKYVQDEWKSALIIGLTVGLTGLLILAIFVAWLLCFVRLKQNRRRREEDESSIIGRLGMRSSDYRRMTESQPVNELDNEDRRSPTNYFNYIFKEREKGASSRSDIPSISRETAAARNRGFYDVDGRMKNQVYGEFLKPRDRISYTRPMRLEEDNASSTGEQPQRTHAQVYHNSSFQKLLGDDMT